MLVDVTHPMMRPARDPVRSLIYAAGDRAVRTVFVDGERVVDDGRVLTMDYPAAAEALHEAQKRIMRPRRARLGPPPGGPDQPADVQDVHE